MMEATTDWAENDSGKSNGLMVMWGTIFVPSSILSVIYEYCLQYLYMYGRSFLPIEWSNGMLPPGYPLILAIASHPSHSLEIIPYNNRKDVLHVLICLFY